MHIVENKLTQLVTAFVVVAIGLVFIVIYTEQIPYNMDEFTPYHPLSCQKYPGNELNTFREGCGSHDIMLPFSDTQVSLRAYDYIGSFRALIYAPLHALWAHPLSHRLIGFIFLILQAIVLRKITKIRFEYLFLILLFFFSYSYLHFMDTTSISFHILSIYLFYYFVTEWLQKFKFRYLLYIALMVVIGVWVKLVYLWYLPSLLAIFVTLSILHRDSVRIHFSLYWKHILDALIVSGALLAVYFFSRDMSGAYLYEILFVAPSHSIMTTVLTFHRSVVAFWVFNPFEAMQKSFSMPNILPLPQLAVAGVYAITIFFAGVPLWILHTLKSYGRTWKQAVPTLIMPAILFGLFWVSLMIASASQYTGHMHHIIIFYPFLILAFLLLLSRHNQKVIAVTTIVFIAANTYFFAEGLKLPIKAYDDASKVTVNQILNDEQLAAEYVYVAVDWGMYYYQALYGPQNQSVIYIEPFNTTAHVAQVNQLKHETGKNLLFISMGHTDFVAIDPREESDWTFIEQSFDLTPCASLAQQDTVWNIYFEASEYTPPACR